MKTVSMLLVVLLLESSTLPASSEQLDIDRGHTVPVSSDVLGKEFAYPDFAPAVRGGAILPDRVRSFRLGILHVDLKVMISMNNFIKLREFQRALDETLHGVTLSKQDSNIVNSINSLQGLRRDAVQKFCQERIDPFFLNGNVRFIQLGESIESLLLTLRAGKWLTGAGVRIQDQYLQSLKTFSADVSVGRSSLDGLHPDLLGEINKIVIILSVSPPAQADRSGAIAAIESVKRLF